MALDDILRKIKADAQAEAEAVLRAAHAERERVLTEARERARAVAEQIRSPGKVRAEDARRKELAMAGLEARRIVLEAKQRILDGAFEAALERLSSLPDEQYRELLAGLVAQGAQTGAEEIIVSPEDRARLGEDFPELAGRRLEAGGLPGKLRYASRTRPLRGGLILASEDVDINMSFERTMATLRGSIEPEIARLLFDGPEPEREAEAAR